VVKLKTVAPFFFLWYLIGFGAWMGAWDETSLYEGMIMTLSFSGIKTDFSNSCALFGVSTLHYTTLLSWVHVKKIQSQSSCNPIVLQYRSSCSSSNCERLKKIKTAWCMRTRTASTRGHVMTHCIAIDNETPQTTEVLCSITAPSPASHCAPSS